MADVVVVAGQAESLLNFRGPLLAELVRRGHCVTAMAPPASGAELTAGLAALGVRFEPIPLARTGLNPLQDLRLVLHLRRRFATLRPDLMLAYTVKPVVWGTFAAWLARVPQRISLVTGLGFAFTDVGGSPPGQGTAQRPGIVQRLIHGLYRMAMELSTRVLFQNPDDLALFSALGLLRRPDKARVVAGSGVDLDHYAPAPLPPGPPVFLMVARLLGDKGLREYAAAAALLRDQFPQAVCQLLGPPDTNPSAVPLSEVTAWHEAGTLQYLGEARDVRTFLRNCTVFVLPSYREGTPRTALEAMATGRAIITTDVPGCREVVQHGLNGLQIPPRDATALAAAMLQLAQAPQRCERMGSASLEMARSRFDVRLVNRDMVEWIGL